MALFGLVVDTIQKNMLFYYYITSVCILQIFALLASRYTCAIVLGSVFFKAVGTLI